MADTEWGWKKRSDEPLEEEGEDSPDEIVQICNFHKVKIYI